MRNKRMGNKPIKKEINTSCFHCGDECRTEVLLDDKKFCCEGCKTVYNILNENNLCNYYDLNETPGINIKVKKEEKYSFLDNIEIQDKIIDFKEENTIKIRFHLPQIHCSSCIWLLEKLYQLKEGINASQVNFNKKEISISFNSEVISLRSIAELLSSLGYPPLIHLDKLENNNKYTDKTIYYQLGLAGFAFGNIMLLSFPEYLGLENNDEYSFSHTFGYLNILLSLPVIFYCAKDYLFSAWIAIKEKNPNIDVPISIGVITLFARSVYEIISQTGAGYLDSLAGLVFFLLIGKWFQKKTYDSLSFDRDYKSYFPISSTVLKNEKEIPTPLNKLKKSDIILVRNGELIPADGILMNGTAIVDYSFVSGESKTVKKEENEKIYAGGRQMGAAITLQVIKDIEQSYLTQLWNNDIFNKKDSRLIYSAITDKIAKNFTWIILSIALFTFLYWFPQDSTIAFNATTAVLIVACPCALALAAPFVFGNVMRILGKKGFYLKNTRTVEKIAEISHIVFDKTGTITSNDNQLKASDIHLFEKEKQYIKSLCYHSSHPVSKGIYAYFSDEKILKVEDFKETTGKGIFGIIEDHYIRVGSASFLGINKNKGTYLEIDGKIKGSFMQPVSFRKGIKEMIKHFSKQYHLSLISGDTDESKEELLPLFKNNNSLLFKQSPEDKLNYIKSLQKDNKKVMMVGDGLNDAGALRQSDVGLVITENINNFTPASDIIINAENILELPKFIDYTKKSIYLLYAAYIISFCYNIIGLYFAVQGELSPVIAAILMPLSSITTVLFAVISTNLLLIKK